ncbi:CGNR zinc finger domain-containing protein [Arthrobacter sp. zg-Y844]|uniref:CGNR zinc finger domain-containing protein n=1 Tax=Arthrobacter sp. zg-Y844 TaxID=2964612 RepID=UPI002102207A|nr:CGNR zinc finger domain-containing protein [Arthrobacter sp. zg-Y844]MCQ1987090.1 CGNR zinc finger domain-containing protein [Arthrobacter sp. zg-Y844]
MVEDEDLLLALLNSTPVVAGRPTDGLAGASCVEFVARYGGTGSQAELAHLRRMRECLQDAVRGSGDALSRLSTALGDGVLIPRVTPQGLHWEVRAPEDERIAFRAALAWSRVVRELPGRLRPCANNECNLFLIDRSRPGTAKWCSMAVCGNRMKARSHAGRQRAAADRP